MEEGGGTGARSGMWRSDMTRTNLEDMVDIGVGGDGSTGTGTQ
jgi:hypothetical protein